MDTGIHVFFGSNGQGKTSLLESIYCLLTTKSFKTHFISECTKFGESEFNIKGSLIKKDVVWSLEIENRQKITNRFVNSKKETPLDYLTKGSAIIFSSRSKRIVDGSPEERRKFLNRMISLVDSRYLILLSKYRRHNHNLKKIIHSHKPDLDLYRSFKKTMLPISLEIARRRIEFIHEIEEKFKHIYAHIFSETESINLHYLQKNCQDINEFEKRYMDSSAQELLYKRQIIGPHLDDLILSMNQSSARKYCSSGQLRSIVLSLKCAVRELVFEKTGTYPIFLIDDIDSELDESRLKNLIEFLNERGQTLISSTKYGKLVDSCRLYGYEVKNGKINPLGQMYG